MKVVKLLFALSAIMSLAACTVSLGGAGKTNDAGGIFKTINRGDVWVQKGLIPTASGRPGSISGVNTSMMAPDPSDSNAIYLGALENGLFFSYDGAETWQISSQLAKGTVKVLAIDPASKCVIYAGIANRLYKSTDCSRTWLGVYNDNDPKIEVSALAIDQTASNNIYIGTSRGEIIKSNDRGSTWRTLNRTENRIAKIIISPSDSRMVFAASSDKGIYRSADGGESWDNLKNKFKDFKTNQTFRDLVASKEQNSVLFYGVKGGLFKSVNNGDDWTKVNLITSGDSASINAIAVNPSNSNEIYYVTNTTFYRSLDGGVNWATKRLPTVRGGSALLVDQANPNVIYLGVKALK
jgi:photosystem II stability/assembly factor-like uncharacterized protein